MFATKGWWNPLSVRQRFEAFMKEQADMDLPILACVSGGVDSMALMHLLYCLCPRRLHVFHLNHQLRPDAAADAQLVEDTAKQWQLPVHVYSYDVAAHAAQSGQSIQAAARQVRLQYMEHCAQHFRCHLMATGHHWNDRAETVLMRILRGTGVPGLTGIKPVSGRLIRPLLQCTKEELYAYCRQEDVPYREDPSNAGEAYFRNRVRHRVLPVLKEESPAVEQHLNTLAVLAEEDNDFLEMEAEALFETLADRTRERLALDRGRLRSLHPALQRRVLRQFVFAAQGHTRRLGYGHVERLRQLALGQGAFQTDIPSLRIEGTANIIQVGEPDREEEWQDAAVPLSVPGTVAWETGVISADWVQGSAAAAQVSPPGVEYFDARTLQRPLVVRRRRPGDSMQVFGGGHKKIKDILMDAKVPRHDRGRLPVICDQRNILWIPGVRRSEKGRITSETKEIIRLTFSPVTHCHG